MNKEGSYYVDEEAGQLILKNGEVEESFIIEEEVLFDGRKYLILVPDQEDEDENRDALVLKMVQDGEQKYLSIIEDEKEFQNVKERYLNK